MRKTSLTEANTITADLVLQLSKMYSAKDLRGVQTKLTKTSRELRGLTSGNTLLGRVGQQLSFDQRELLKSAAKLIESVCLSVECAKEKLHRAEVAATKRQKARECAARKIIAYAYPLPSETLEQKLEIIRIALILNRAGCFQLLYTPHELSLRYRSFVTDTPKIYGWETPKSYWKHRVSSIRSDLIDEIQQHLAFETDGTVHERFLELQHQVKTIQLQVSQDPYEIETLRLWAQVLSSAELHEETQ